MKRALSWLLAIALVVSLATPVMAAEGEGPFSDVGANNRFAPAISWVADEGIASGYGNGEFRPDNFCTRGHIVMFLWNMAGNPEPTTEEMPFSDVTMNNRYAKAILWAVETGVTSGYTDGTFRMDNECSRQHAVQFLYNYFGKPYVDAENPFGDVSESNRFKDAIVWAASYGIANGRANGNFDPEASCTRAHIAQFLYNTRPGTKVNPIQVMPEEIPYTFEASVAAGSTVYYMGYGLNGMILSVDGVEAQTLTAQYPMMPVNFEISNETEEDAVYEVVLSYPAGSQMNPETIEFDTWTDVSLEAGDYDGYYYSYTPTADGSITLYISGITEGVTGDIIVTNMATYAQRTLSADGIDNYGLELHLDVVAGEELMIQVVAQYDENWNIPAADISWVGQFAYPEGSEQNPVFVEFEMTEDWSEGTATVTVPAGETVYYACYNAGMVLSINGEEWGTLTAAGMGRAPAVFSITNEGTEDAEYALHVKYPVGNSMNPETVEFDTWTDVSLEAGDYDGYYYSYTPTADGSITLYIASITDGVTGDIIVTNMVTSAQKTLSADGIDNYGLELHLDVVAGEELMIQVVAQYDENWNIPAADISWVGQFAYPEGSEQNPVFVEFEMTEDWSEGTATVTVPAGETVYYACYNAGMVLSINGEEWGTLTAAGMGRAPAVFSITNDGEEDAEYALHVKYPAGHQMNPEVIELDISDSVSLEANDFDGYFYSYTPKYSGTVTLSISNVTEGVQADIVVTNQTSYAQRSLSSDGVDGTLTLDVVAGEELIIQIVVQADENWNYPAADVEWAGDLIVPVPETAAQIVEDAYALEDGEVLPYTATLTGVITKINSPYSSSYKNISVVIAVEGLEDKPILCYRMIDNANLSLEYSIADLIVGDTITVTGSIKNFKGTIEFDAKCTMDAIVKAEGEVPTAPEDPAEIIDAAYALEQGASLPYTATLTGKITEIKTAFSSQYNNITVVIEVEGSEDQPIICFRMKGTGADVIAVGDTITVTGTIKNYYGDIEFDSGCTLDSYVKAETEDSEDPDVVVIPENVPAIYEPVANTAYKFGLYQVTNDSTLYITGEVNGRYLSMTEDLAEAADVYVETAEGGYLFYILVDGEKSYIQVYLNDSSKISVQYAAEGSVFAYSTEKFCWVTSVDGTDYYLGTYSSFTTISASKTSYIDADKAGVSQFPAGFFVAE